MIAIDGPFLLKRKMSPTREGGAHLFADAMTGMSVYERVRRSLGVTCERLRRYWGCPAQRQPYQRLRALVTRAIKGQSPALFLSDRVGLRCVYCWSYGTSPLGLHLSG